MRVYVIATSPFPKKVMDNKFFFTIRDAKKYKEKCGYDLNILVNFDIYPASLEIIPIE